MCSERIEAVRLVSILTTTVDGGHAMRSCEGAHRGYEIGMSSSEFKNGSNKVVSEKCVSERKKVGETEA